MISAQVAAPVFVRGKAGFAAIAEGLRHFDKKETISDLAGLNTDYVRSGLHARWAA